MPNKRRVGGGKWDKLRKQVLVEEDYICHLCGGAGADSADHILPIKFYPELEFVRSNLRAAHLKCNIKRGAKPLTIPKTVNFSRSW